MTAFFPSLRVLYVHTYKSIMEFGCYMLGVCFLQRGEQEGWLMRKFIGF